MAQSTAHDPARSLRLSFSGFLHARDTVPIRVDCTWGELCDSFGPHEVRAPKKSCPMLSPAIFSGSQRLAKDALAVSMMIADFDHNVDADLITYIYTVLRSLGVAYIIHTSYSHTPASPRIRIYIPLSRPVLPDEWSSFYPRVRALWDYKNDRQCSDISRAYFGPYCPDGASLAHAMIEKGPGVPLNTDAFLAAPLADRSERVAEDLLGTAPVDRQALKNVLVKIKKRTDLLSAQCAAPLTALLKGEAFAEQGNRDTAIYNLAKLFAREIPYASPSSLAQAFGPSLATMAQAYPDDAFTVDQAEDKIRRCQIKHFQKQLDTVHTHEQERKTRIRQAFRYVHLDRDTPYTPQELQHLASAENCTTEELNKRWVIRCGSAVYFYVNGEYIGPATATSDAPNWAEIFLAPATSAGVSPFKMSTSGERSLLSAEALTSSYGQIAKEVIIDTSATRSYFDPVTSEIVEAPYRRREIQPTYNANVQRWLELLGGDKKGLLLSWLSHLTDLANPIPMLFLFGAGGAGKSLLANGLARIWSENGPTNLTLAMANFNDCILKNPLLFGDETLPKDNRSRVRTDDLREAIQARTLPLKRKFQPVATMRGSLRLMAAANDDSLFTQSGDLTAEDIDALSSRLLLINVGNVNACAARDFLKTVQHDDWVSGDVIAAHVLYLNQSKRQPREGRFGIVDSDNYLKRALTTRTGARFAVCMFLTRYLMRPEQLDMTGRYELLRKDGHLYVKASAVLDHWDLYMGKEKCPQASAIKKAISGISTGRDKIYTPKGPSQYRRIDNEILIAWAEDSDEISGEDMRQILLTNTVIK